MDEPPDQDNITTEKSPGEHDSFQVTSVNNDVTSHERSVYLSSLTAQITCGLCHGYLVDAQTVTDCIHSFCRSCIVKHLLGSDSCPQCGNKIYKTQPLLNIRSDRKLQGLVYKLVPNLFQDEMLKRRDFFKACPPKGFDMSCDQQVSLCLRLCDRYPPYENIKEKDLCVDKRYLLCPASFTVSLMEKFVRLKFNLSSKYKVDLFCENERLYEDYSLLDVALVFGWQRKKPLLINYVVNDTTYTIMKKLQMVENKGINHKVVFDGRISTSATDNITHSDSETQKTEAKSKKRKSSQNENDVASILEEGSKSVVSKHLVNNTMNYPRAGIEMMISRPPPFKRKRGRPPKRAPVGIIARQAQRKIIKKLQEHSEKVVVIAPENEQQYCYINTSVDNSVSNSFIQDIRNEPLDTSDKVHEQMDMSNKTQPLERSEIQETVDSSVVRQDHQATTAIIDLLLDNKDKQTSTSSSVDKLVCLKMEDNVNNSDTVLKTPTVSHTNVIMAKDTETNQANYLNTVSSLSESSCSVSVSSVQSAITTVPSSSLVSSSQVNFPMTTSSQANVPLVPSTGSFVPQSLHMMGNYQVMSANNGTVITAAIPQQLPNSNIINMESVRPQTMTGIQYSSGNNTITQQVPTPQINTRVLSGQYNVGYLPFHQSIPKVKRKRGRPPKNRSLSSFTGRSSPMPHTLSGIPGSPFYTLIKKKRGRPPKRKVGLPPVFVVPQQNSQQVSAPVYVQNVSTNQNMTFLHKVNGLQISNNTVSQTGSISQVNTPSSCTLIQSSPSIKPDGSGPNIVGPTSQNNINVISQDSSKTKNIAPTTGVLDSDKQSETDFEYNTLISQDVVGNIIEKLADDKNIDTPPPSSAKPGNHGNASVYIPVDNSPHIIKPHLIPGQIKEEGQVLHQSHMYQIPNTVSSGNKGTVMVLSQPTSNTVNNTKGALIMPQTKPHISLYEKQFENFIHHGKFQSNNHGQVVYNIPTSNMIVLNNTNHIPHKQASNNQQKSDFCNTVTDSSCGLSTSVQPCESTTVINDNHCDSISTNNLPSLSESIIQSKEHIPHSNPTSPDSSISEGDQSFSSRDGSTPNSKRHVSSSVLKEQKRHNLNKLTEKLHSLGEKKKPKEKLIKGHEACNEVNGDIELVNGGTQRKSVISAVVSNTDKVVNLNKELIKGSINNTDKMGDIKKALINAYEVKATGDYVGQQQSKLTQQQTPIQHLSQMSTPDVSVRPGIPNCMAVNGYQHCTVSSPNQRNAEYHSYKGSGLQGHNRQTINGGFHTDNVSQVNVLSKMKMSSIQGEMGLKPGQSMLDYGKANKINNSKKFARMAQKRKQQAVQRLNNKNKGPQGPFYVGVNVFNYPLFPQGTYRNTTATGDDASIVYKDYNTGNNNSDKPLDFSIKKK